MKKYVEGTFPDNDRHKDIGRFRLHCNKPMHPHLWIAPIIWKGVVNDTNVEFTQVNSEGSSMEDYDFTGYPSQLKHARPYIVKAINNEMRKMD